MNDIWTTQFITKEVLGDSFFILVNTFCVYYLYKEGKIFGKLFEWNFKGIVKALLLGILTPLFIAAVIYGFIGWFNSTDWKALSLSSMLSFFVGMYVGKMEEKKTQAQL